MEKFYLLLWLAPSLAFGGNLGPGSIPPTAPAAFNMTDPTEDRQSNGQPAQVRIGLRLTPFVTAKTQNLKGEIREISRPAGDLKRTLRARVNRMNHFVVSDYHVESEPLSYVKETSHYRVKLKFSKRLGPYGELEESIGSMEVAGKLEGSAGVYVLKGAASSEFKDPMGRPVLRVMAGFGEVMSSSSQLSKAAPPVMEKSMNGKQMQRAPMPGASRSL
jgi:hypothetical protein